MIYPTAKEARQRANEVKQQLKNPEAWKVTVIGGGSQHQNCYWWYLDCGRLRLQVDEAEYHTYQASLGGEHHFRGGSVYNNTKDNPQAAVDGLMKSVNSEIECLKKLLATCVKATSTAGAE